MKNNSKMINRVINVLFKSLVFLLPLFFLPWTTTLSGMDNFNKQNLLFVIMPLIGFLFFFARLKQSKLSAKCSIFDYPILVFLGVAAAASIFSVDKFSSVFGAYSYIEQSFIATFCFALLYFFVVNFFSKESEVSSFLKIFFKIYVILISTSSILVLGYWTKLLTSSTLSAWFKLGVGTLDDLAVLIAVLNVLVFGLLYDGHFARSVFKNVLWERLIKLSIVLSFILLILINFSPAWLCLLVGSIFVAFVDYFYFGAKRISFGKKLFRFTRDKKVLWLNIAILIPLVILMLLLFLLQ